VRNFGSLKFGNFRLSYVRECTFRLDGGAMFGVVPKPLWNKLSPADDLNRILLSCNLLLIDTGAHKVLVETGMGTRWSRQEMDRYEVKTLVDPLSMLEAVGVRNDEVDYVVISHMHFDHMGGAVRADGEKLLPTFPNAKYVVQKKELQLARTANARAKASYRQEDYEPLEEAGLLHVIDGDREIVAGVFARVTGGHTHSHQVVAFESGPDHGVFFADIMPTKAHVSPPWVMGYDHFPLDSCDVKSVWLNKCAKEGWLVVFDHETGTPWGRVHISDKGKYEFEPLAEDATEFVKTASAATAKT
jgi:glyoxylase-like metal-dependent hydrolase (beta-lactamase superfamily II)